METTVIELGEVRKNVLDALEYKSLIPALNDHARRHGWDGLGEDAWEGASTDQIRDWLRNGYRMPGLDGFDAMAGSTQDRRKLLFADEGELQVDLALSGFDEPYLRWQKRPRKPGLAVRVDASFVCGSNPKVIGEFFKWTTRVISHLEASGYDLDLSVAATTQNTYANMGTTCSVTRVKRENEWVDFSEYSIMFSPVSFRVMTFAAFYTVADKRGWKCTGGLGSASGNKWALDFDPVSRLLVIRTPYTPRDFPADKMTEDLRKLEI